MRRIVIALVVLGALAWATLALAQSLNNYAASITYGEIAAGTTTAPAGLSWTEALTVTPLVSGGTNVPVTDVRTELPQVNFAYQKYFPVCTAATIKAAGTDTACPAGAEIGTGSFYSQLAQASFPTDYRACNPDLDIWNGGDGTLVYFMTLGPRHQCDGLRTGSIPPWNGRLTESGTTMLSDLPFPAAISTDVGGGLWSGLQTLDLRILKTVTPAPVPTEITEKYTVKVKVTVHGKTKLETKSKTKRVLKTITRNVAFFQSTGCSANQRPFTVRVTATNGSATNAADATGSAAC